MIELLNQVLGIGNSSSGLLDMMTKHKGGKSKAEFEEFVRLKENPNKGFVNRKDFDTTSDTPWREETDNLVKTQYESQYGFPIYENEFGTRMSEKSVTIPMNDQFYNFRTIYDGKHFNEDQVKNMFLDGSIKPTSVHKTYDEAINSAKIRSDGIQHMLPEGTYARDDEGTATGEYTANVGRMKQYYDYIDKHGTNLGFTRY
jgi:hypothetical protein